MEAALARSRKVIPANVTAARSEVEAARAALRDLERGNRPEEIAQAQAEVAAAEATLTRARLEAARQERLFQEGAAARSAVEDAQEAQTRAEAALKARQEALALLRSGFREERIAEARARLNAALARQEAAEGELAGLELETRRVAEAAATLRAAQAAQAEIQSAAARLETLRHEAAAARARVGQSQAVARQAGASLMERAVVAPFAGLVGRRYVDPGDMASPSQPLFSIVETETVWVVAEVDEQDLAPVREGQEAIITAPAYVGREFRGKVTRIGGEAVPQTEIRTGARIVRVRISLAPTPPSERKLLKPGMEVHASGRATLLASAILLPSDALLTDDRGNYVWVMENGQVRQRRVRAGYVNGRETEIVSGLQAGETVVLNGKEGLRDGARAQPRAPLKSEEPRG
jgi:HlyD family secretion protein